MARFTAENLELAREIIARYPVLKSATIPLCHLAQEQDGHLTEDAMEHIAELLELSPAEVLGTASFYEMFKLHPVGTYHVNICTQVACMLLGADELRALRARIDTAVYARGRNEVSVKQQAFPEALELVDAILETRRAA